MEYPQPLPVFYCHCRILIKAKRRTSGCKKNRDFFPSFLHFVGQGEEATNIWFSFLSYLLPRVWVEGLGLSFGIRLHKSAYAHLISCNAAGRNRIFKILTTLEKWREEWTNHLRACWGNVVGLGRLGIFTRDGRNECGDDFWAVVSRCGCLCVNGPGLICWGKECCLVCEVTMREKQMSCRASMIIGLNPASGVWTTWSNQWSGSKSCWLRIWNKMNETSEIDSTLITRHHVANTNC